MDKFVARVITGGYVLCIDTCTSLEQSSNSLALCDYTGYINEFINYSGYSTVVCFHIHDKCLWITAFAKAKSLDHCELALATIMELYRYLRLDCICIFANEDVHWLLFLHKHGFRCVL